MPTLYIETERLYLSKILEADADKILRYRSHPDVFMFQRWCPVEMEDVLGFIRKYSTTFEPVVNRWNQLGIYLKEGKSLIGDCGFSLFEKEQAEIGYTIDPQHQQHGYATEAMQGMIHYLFGELRLHRVIARTDPMNIASQRVLSKLQFRQEAHFRQSIREGNHWKDDLVFALLSEEYTP
jgi:RimJ/RimL family protein N-acetyltransferase